MLIKKNIPGLIILLISSITVFYCAPDLEKKFNSGFVHYKEGKIPEAAREFEAGLAGLMSKRAIAINGTNISTCDRAVFHQQNGSVEILYPDKIKINISPGFNLISYDTLKKQTALSDGKEIKIFNKEGILKKIFTPSVDDKNVIKAVLIKGNDLIYFIGKRIYTCNITTDKAGYLIDERFNRPGKDPYYNLYLGYEKDTLSLVIGIGGEYYLSLIDMRKKKVLLKNKKISSSKIIVNGEDVFFISGKSGKWALKKYSITKKSIQTLAKLKDIIDIEFLRTGLLLENNDGLGFLLYSSKNREDLHFNYKLAGSCNGYPLLQSKDEIHVADMDKLYNKLKFIKNEAPAIFLK